jgi:hypothetical protein
VYQLESFKDKNGWLIAGLLHDDVSSVVVEGICSVTGPVGAVTAGAVAADAGVAQTAAQPVAAMPAAIAERTR